MARRRLALVFAALVLTSAACNDGADDDRPAAGSTDTSAETLAEPTPAPSADEEAVETGSTGTVVGAPGRVDDGGGTSAPVSASGTVTSIDPSTTGAPTATSAPVVSTTSTTTTTIDPDVPPRVQAAAWTVYDMRSGEMLASNNATQRRPVASLMKLLTAQVAFDAGQPTKLVTAPSDGLVLSDDESVIDIRPGQELSRDLLVRAMLKASANDAARLLALDIAGSEAAFAELMNATAASLQLGDTHAVNATGLDAEGQYSTAYDMTMLAARLMGSSINFQVAVRDPTAELNGQAYPNPNDLLGTYPGADGIKTGHTSGAGWCIVASAIRDGRRLVVTVLGAPTREARNAAASTLLDWGFAQPA